MRATRIKMKMGYFYSKDLEEIDSVWIEGCSEPGYYKKEIIHDYVKNHPGSIQVDIWPYPNLIPATSSRGEKYVRSTPNSNQHDDLLDLPRE